MLWIVFTLFAAVGWMSADLLSKFIMDKEIKDGVVAAGTVGISQFIPTAIIPLFFAGVVFTPAVAIPSFMVGIFYSLGILFYYVGIGKEEVSRFIPALSTTAIFTAVFAFVFIGESFNLWVYVGIIAVVSGAILISLESLGHFQSLKGFSLSIIAAIFFASRNVSLKIATSSTSLWSALFWVGVGGSIVSAIFLVSKRSKLKKSIKGGEHMFEVGLLCVVAYFAYAKAISLGPVSLASAILKVKILLIFVASTLITRLRPSFISEEIDKKTIVQKAIAIILIIGGIVLIQLFF